MHEQHRGGPSEARPTPAGPLGNQSGERTLGFALRTAGVDRVLEELRRSTRFGARCRRFAAVAGDAEEREAWSILASAGPRTIERRLERDGLTGRTPGSSRPRPRSRRDAEEASVSVRRGRAEFGARAARTPFQEQLAEVALAMAEGA